MSDYFVYFDSKRIGRVMKFDGNGAKKRWVGYANNDKNAAFSSRREAMLWVQEQAFKAEGERA